MHIGRLLLTYIAVVKFEENRFNISEDILYFVICLPLNEMICEMNHTLNCGYEIK